MTLIEAMELLKEGKPVTVVGSENTVYLIRDRAPGDFNTYRVVIDEETGDQKISMNPGITPSWFMNDWVEYTGYITTRLPQGGAYGK
jgi:hypothetical protein